MSLFFRDRGWVCIFFDFFRDGGNIWVVGWVSGYVGGYMGDLW